MKNFRVHDHPFWVREQPMLYVFDLLVENISVITHQHLVILVMRIVNCTEELVHEVDVRQQDLWFELL